MQGLHNHKLINKSQMSAGGRYEIEIPGEARGKARARVTRFGAYTPARTKNAEAWIRQCAVAAGVTVPLTGALKLTLQVFRSVPASWPAKKRAAALAGGLKPTGKPDTSNIVKTFEDALNKLAWDDDSQIVCLHAKKDYAERDYTLLTVEQI